MRDSRIMLTAISGGVDMGKGEGEDWIDAETVKVARAASGLNQADAAKLVYTSIDNWQNWEQGRNSMAQAVYELFLLKTGQFTLREIVPGAPFATMRLRLRTGRIVDLQVKHAVLKNIAEAAA
jgi:hypothetical protein